MRTIKVVNYQSVAMDGNVTSEIFLLIQEGVFVKDKIHLFKVDENTTWEKEIEKLKQKLS